MHESTKIAVNIWVLTSAALGLGVLIFCLFCGQGEMSLYGFVVGIVGAIASLPVLLFLYFLLPFINKIKTTNTNKWWLLMLVLFMLCLPYGTIAGFTALLNCMWLEAAEMIGLWAGALFACAAIAAALIHKQISNWMNGIGPPSINTYSPGNQELFIEKERELILENTLSNIQQIPINMYNQQNDTNEQFAEIASMPPSGNSNKIVIKTAITAGLILAMLIPTAFIINLVQEREKRQKDVTDEVSSKWALPQTFTTPYLCIPYKQISTNDTGKTTITRTMVFEAADLVNVKAKMQPEMLHRSIYNVLLYKSDINLSGSIMLKPNKEIVPENLQWAEAKLCVGISDFRGIEEKANIIFNDTAYELEPGLPDNTIDKQGLSAPINITQEALTKGVSFSMNIKVKGSEQLHFLPLSSNSNFEITSTWASPSFDGSSLPKERSVTDSGFVAKWSFNKANMPVLSQLLNAGSTKESMAFGVSMVQPADQYAKTNRSVKYAILFVGLTFAMFFIIELMQKKNVHPVQYVLVGLALIIFYTLLLSIGEFTGFNIAYGIAASATVLLIGIYSNSLFSSAKTSISLSLFIGMLYGFIYVLIQLEDTALLAGSIGLFALLAVAMYFSKKIDWQGTEKRELIMTT